MAITPLLFGRIQKMTITGYYTTTTRYQKCRKNKFRRKMAIFCFILLITKKPQTQRVHWVAQLVKLLNNLKSVIQQPLKYIPWSTSNNPLKVNLKLKIFMHMSYFKLQVKRTNLHFPSCMLWIFSITLGLLKNYDFYPKFWKIFVF